MDAPQQFDPKLLNLSVEKQIENAVAAERERWQTIVEALIDEFSRSNDYRPDSSVVRKALAAIRKGE